MTNYEYIKSASKEALAELLTDLILMVREHPEDYKNLDVSLENKTLSVWLSQDNIDLPFPKP
jgi:hypothetical protein